MPNALATDPTIGEADADPKHPQGSPAHFHLVDLRCTVGIGQDNQVDAKSIGVDIQIWDRDNGVITFSEKCINGKSRRQSAL